MQIHMTRSIEICAKDDQGNFVCDPQQVFPNKTDDSMVKKMPPAVILTAEFDYNRKMAEEAG